MVNLDSLMTAVLYDENLRVVKVPKPKRKENEVLIKVVMAGLCNTDIEITRGYIPGFNGIIGHEFVGIIEEADEPELSGKRCTAEINCGCGICEFCMEGLNRHCPNRTVLGIISRNGCFAEYVCVPRENVILIPDSIPDNRALFIEPLAAALEIIDQVSLSEKSTVLLLGDGKLGLLIAHVLAATGCSLTIVGKHAEKLKHLTNNQYVTSVLLNDFIDSQFDIVVEATGNNSSFERAIKNCKPRGIVVLKSTYAGNLQFNLSPVVVNEITLIGSRCGKFSNAIDFLINHSTQLENMISAEIALKDALQAFKYSESHDVLKIILKP